MGVVFVRRMFNAHLLHISWFVESQCKGGRPHGSPVPKGAPTIKLVSGRLVHVTELRGGQLLQHLDHSGSIPAARGRTVLLSKPRGGNTGSVSFTSIYLKSFGTIFTL